MAVIYCCCNLCPEKFPEKKSRKLVVHMQEHHRLDNELSDSSDSESDQAEPIQVLTKLRRREITTKANRLPSGNTTKHADLDNAKPTQPSPKDPPSHHDPQPTRPSRQNPSHQEHPELRQPSIMEYFNHQERLNHPPRAAPSNGMPKTPVDFASLPREHGVTASNTGSEEIDQRLQDRGATSALITSSTTTKKRRRVLDDGCSSASDNPPKRLRPDGHR